MEDKFFVHASNPAPGEPTAVLIIEQFNMEVSKGRPESTVRACARYPFLLDDSEFVQAKLTKYSGPIELVGDHELVDFAYAAGLGDIDEMLSRRGGAQEDGGMAVELEKRTAGFLGLMISQGRVNSKVVDFVFEKCKSASLERFLGYYMSGLAGTLEEGDM